MDNLNHMLTEVSPVGKCVFDERTERTSIAKWANPIEVSRGVKHLVRGATQLIRVFSSSKNSVFPELAQQYGAAIGHAKEPFNSGNVMHMIAKRM